MANTARAKRRDQTPACPRCGTAMDEVVSIAPSFGDPGLIAYECPNCVYVTSELVQPADEHELSEHGSRATAQASRRS
jgi:C4-type Zn-finger protein